MTKGPSSTQRAFSTHSTFSLWLVAREKNCLFEVARRPSRRPAFARIAEPEQTDSVASARRERARRNSWSAALSSCASVPIPPGSSSRSSCGALAKSKRASVSGPWAEATGPAFSATVTMRSSGPRLPNISRGP